MNSLKHLVRWFNQWVEQSFEHQLDQFERFGSLSKRELRRRKGVLSPSKRLIWGTELAVLTFLCMVILQALSIVFLREFQADIMSAILVVLSFLAGTYWGRHG